MLEQRWTWEFDAPRERLWRYVADTDWVNEHAGLPRITARFEPAPGGGTQRFGSFWQGPIFVQWEERPTVWKVPEFFAVDRVYSRGPLRRFINKTTLEAIGPERTRIVSEIHLEAALPLLNVFLPLLAAHGKRGANRAFGLAAKLALKGTLEKDSAGGDIAQQFAAIGRFGIDDAISSALTSFVETAADRDLSRMRPYELADRWGLSRREVLRGFLAATRSGLFNLRWSVICPGCRGPSNSIDSLSELESGYHCPSCNLPYDAAFDRSVEVTFNARPLGHAVEDELFCLASPQRSAHVYLQCAAVAGAIEEALLTLPAGNYDVNAVGVAVAPLSVSNDEAGRDLRIALTESRLEMPHGVGSGELRVTIANELDRDTILRIEDGRWPDTIVTAAQVTALQEFRDLFSSEVLAPGLELGVETAAVLFTDLIGSTAMYSRAGDAPAFRIVNEHFDVMREIVSRHEGAIVKTIGDAVMAVFVDPAKCFDAAVELDRAVMTIEQNGVPLRLRVGFHAGPCIAMRANDRIDYFGTTVNLAARLQSLARAGEVTMARSDAERPSIAERIAELRAPTTTEALNVKGFEVEIDVVRVACG